MKKIQLFFGNLKQSFRRQFTKDEHRHQYAQPTYTRTILGYLACAAACFRRGGYNDDAKAWREFCFDIFDSDRAEEAFAVAYELETGWTSEEYYAGAERLLKYAGVKLHDQQVHRGEDNWTLFLREVKAMKVRARERNASSEQEVDDIEGELTRIRNGDRAMIESVYEMARRFREEAIFGRPDLVIS